MCGPEIKLAEILKRHFPKCGKPGCRIHVAGTCYRNQGEMKKEIAPGYLNHPIYTDAGQPFEVTRQSHPEKFAILYLAVLCTPDRERPDTELVKFVKERRIYRKDDPIHWGWTPVWACGFQWSSWSYQRPLWKRSALIGVEDVFRNEVYHDMREVQMAHPLYGIEMIHVHHDPIFRQLMAEFLAEEGLEQEHIETYKPELPERHVSYIKDRALAERWILFHLQSGSMEAMTAEQHYAAEAELRRSAK